MKENSRISGFFKLNEKERIGIVKKFANLTEKEVKMIKKGFLNSEIREKISENVIGIFPLPYSIAVNFLINGKDYLVPMVTEESSVVAAACYGAKLTRDGGGILARNLGNLMMGQIYITDLKNPKIAKIKIQKEKRKIIELANKQDPVLLKIGGGVKDLELKIFKKTKTGDVLRIHLLIDVKDAMGANAVDSMTEAVAPFIEKIIKGKALLKIVSNLAERRLVEVKAIVTKKSLEKQGFPAKKNNRKDCKSSSCGRPRYLPGSNQ
jgi:hydroxymethylglutaryl-CoA reductase